MERVKLSPEALMIGSAEAAETGRQKRVTEVLNNITATGVSGEIGTTIIRWEELAVRHDRDGVLSEHEEDVLMRIRDNMFHEYGESGVVQILGAWYDPRAVRKREVARETEATAE